MSRIASRTICNDGGEAVRLPQEIAFGGEIDVVVERSGNVITIRPRQDVEADEQRLAQILGAVSEMRLPKKLPAVVVAVCPNAASDQDCLHWPERQTAQG